MRCDTGRDEEKPVHRGWVDAFEMAVYRVRNRDFASFLNATGHPAPADWNAPDFDHPDHPVTAVSWVEAFKYCEWLSSLTGRRCRLPTEAEWSARPGAAAKAVCIRGVTRRRRTSRSVCGAGAGKCEDR
jgi:formylglycine-generating enzyme required for sulfatase activity